MHKYDTLCYFWSFQAQANLTEIKQQEVEDQRKVTEHKRALANCVGVSTTPDTDVTLPKGQEEAPKFLPPSVTPYKDISLFFKRKTG